MYGNGIATPPKGPCRTCQLPGVSHVKLPLKRCRATPWLQGHVAATLASVTLHCATMVASEATQHCDKKGPNIQKYFTALVA